MRLWSSSSIAFLSQLYTLILAAGAPLTVPGSVSQLAANANFTASLNITLPTPKNTTILPPEPYEYAIPGSHQKLTFFHYGLGLSESDTFLCILLAASNVIRVLNNGHDGPIPVPELKYSVAGIHLELLPTNRMTWGMFGTAITGLTDFLWNYDCVDLDFTVVEEGIQGSVGSGWLTYR
ncbi:hypothetical protein ABVK25_010582 [Lepraria finkii]|uniref:Uncharacterized protein n=1 Tax=Lepraria finkii TaxID=1340010 RepID=A0ABR4ATX9_9LECA